MNAYQLLCLEPLEDDAESISRAASRKRGAMLCRRGYVSERIWEQIYSEVEEAVRVLLDPELKASYDSTLRMSADSQLPMQNSGAMMQRGGGEPLECSRCQASNLSTRKFCARCGEPLWEPCVHCGATSPAGERFCGDCGANLAAAVHQQTEQFEMHLLSVEQLEAQGRYEEAMNLLRPISGATHPRLTQHATQASEIIKRLTAQRERALTGAGEILAQGQRLMDEHDYEQAAGLIEGVHASLRSPEMQQLLAEALKRKEETTSLEQELRAAIHKQNISAMLPTITRLLELKPENRQARQLARKIETRISLAAEAKLKGHQYQQAANLLVNVPESLESPQTKSLRQQANELAWIAWDLRNAPVVDGPLLAVVQRMRTLAPTDPRGAKLVAEIERRRKQATDRGGLVLPPWASRPTQTPLGLPIEWLNGFQRIAPGENLDTAVLAAHPGCFAVACGLALQGLGEAHVQIDLHSSGRRSAIGRVAQLFRLRPAAAWGLDIGSTSVKAVKLTWNKKLDTATIEAAALLEYKKPLGQAAGEAEEQGIIDESLTALLSQHDLRADVVCLGLPGRIVLTRLFHLPAAEGEKMATMVEFEAKRQLPAHLNQLEWDFQPLDESDEPVRPARKGAAKKAAVPVLFTAARRNLLSKRMVLMQRLGIRINMTQSECVALHNFLMFERAETVPEDEGESDAPEKSAPLAPAVAAEASLAGRHARCGRRWRQPHCQLAHRPMGQAPWLRRI